MVSEEDAESVTIGQEKSCYRLIDLNGGELVYGKDDTLNPCFVVRAPLYQHS